MDFPREGEGLWTFEYVCPGASGSVFVTLGFVGDSIVGNYDQPANDQVALWWKAVTDVTLVSQATYVGLHTLVGEGSGVVSEWDSPRGDAGGLTGNQMLPINNAVLVKKITGLAGRRERGRFYLPGIPEGAVDDGGIVLSSFRTTINTALATFMAHTLNDLDPPCAPAVLHRAIDIPAKPAYTLPATDGTPIVLFQTEVKQASQRARLRD